MPVPRTCRALAGVLSAVCLLALLPACGGGGGGGGGGGITFLLFSVDPDTSLDLNGGDEVLVSGEGFLAAGIANVTFGGLPATNLAVLDDTTLRVTTPPAPGGNPGAVTVTVISLNAGQRELFAAYTYVAPPSNPDPQTITPTVFTATGAETFTIQGTSLGTPNGLVEVTFAGAGTVTATVNATATLVTGRAPVTPGVPPTGAIVVTLGSGSAAAEVPTRVTFDYQVPLSIGLPNQTAGGASRPVRLADTHGIVCTAGPNGVWGDGDDDVIFFLGPPAPASVQLRRTDGTSPVGWLHPVNSVPVVLDEDTFCLYSVGLDGATGGGDDRITVVTQARTSPVVTDYSLASVINPAPPGKVAATVFATTTAGPNGVLGDGDDELLVFNFATALRQVFTMGPVHLLNGTGNFSIPFSPDGDSVFAMSVGPDGAPSTPDDSVVRLVRSTGAGAVRAAQFFGRPLALNGSLVAAPGPGPNRIFGDNDDDLTVVDFAGVGANHSLGGPLSVTAAVPFARLGTDGVVVAVRGATPQTDRVVAFTNPLGGTSASLTLPGVPLLSPLRGGALVVFGPGPNLTTNDPDDQALFVDSSAAGSTPFAGAQPWSQVPASPGDQDRAFGVVAGAGARLIVHQSRALGAVVSVSSLPLSDFGAPAAGGQPFVPIGPGWGLMQSPGNDGVFGVNLDSILVVRY